MRLIFLIYFIFVTVMKSKFRHSILLLFLFPLQLWAQSDFTANGLNYNIIASNEVRVTIGNYSGIITVPSQVENEGITYNVTQIDNSAFSGLPNLQKLTVSEGITTLWNNAIRNCGRLSEINLPSTLTEIGLGNFGWCKNLMSLNFPNGNSNFWSDGLVLYTADRKTLIRVPSSIYRAPFIVPEGVEIIGNFAFDACELISSIILPSTLKTIKDAAFQSCVFSSIALPEGLQTIEERAFAYCENLTSITIPASVTSIVEPFVYSSAFQGCKKLSVIEVAEGNSAYKSVDGVLFTLDGKTLVAYPQAKTDEVYVIPEGVTRIGNYAFNRECNNLQDFVFPASLTTVGRYSFNFLTNVTSLNIPATITHIDVWGFSANSNVTSLTVAWTNPNQVTLGVSAMGVVDNENLTLYVPEGSASLYRATYPWSRVENIIEYSTEIPTYTVTFSGEEIDIEQQNIEENSLVTRPDDPTRTGYIFDGWYIGSELFDFETPITENITLTAHWTTNQYTVTFDSNNGSEVIPVTTDYNTAITKPEDPTRERHRFDGWFTEATFENEWNFEEDVVTQNTTLYAMWTSTTDIGEILANSRTITGYYSLTGVKLHDEPASGFYIIMYDNGTAEKRIKKE